MRWIRRRGQTRAADQDDSKLAEAEEIRDSAKLLRSLVYSVNPDEFNWQEAHYDHDSRLGRELLFLMANQEWVRATAEVIDIPSSHSIETTIKVDADLSHLTHEAFRKRSGRIWLPVAVLPPFDHHFQPDLFATVTDAVGNPLPMLPAADLRHQIAAAMAEIIAKMAVSHLPNPEGGKSEVNLEEVRGNEPLFVTRDERLLLSAAIYRMLRGESNWNADPAEPRPDIKTLRIKRARTALLALLNRYIELLEDRARTVRQEPDDSRFAPELARRAIKILQALTESVMVVVLADYEMAPSVLTVRVPTRELTGSKPDLIKPWTWIIRPYGHLEIDILLPTAGADRQIQVNLPAGVRLESSDSVKGEIRVHSPQPLRDLAEAMKQVFAAQEHVRNDIWPPDLRKPFIDLARLKSELALDTLMHYDTSRESDEHEPSAGDHGSATDPGEFLKQLPKRLEEPTGAALKALEKDWLDSGIDNLPLSRRIITGHSDRKTQTVILRADMIESAPQRATPKRAKVYLDVIADDRDYFSSAMSSAFMSLILMVGVLCFVVGWHIVNPKTEAPAPEVIAIVLTLFATIQADRIERPERSTLRGRLFTIGNWLIAASVLPALTLALALAFHPKPSAQEYWAAGCILAQGLLLLLMWRGASTPGWPNIGKRRILNTEESDYKHSEALESDYWRNTTAEALMIGLPARGYVVWQKADSAPGEEPVSPQLKPLLTVDKGSSASTEPCSVLALLRSGTPRQATTFVVVRGDPGDMWPEGVDHHAELELDHERLAPGDTVTSRVDVFAGVEPGQMPRIKVHPLVTILKAAANKLTVLDAQFPVPAPVAGHDDWRWARISVALRDSGDIGQLTDFLDIVYWKMIAPENTRHFIIVQTGQADRPQIIAKPATETESTSIPTETPPVADEANEGSVLTSDLDIVSSASIQDGGPDDSSWRVLTICANARSNIESDLIGHLSSIRENFQLAGLIYTLLHGTAVMVLLAHETGVDREHDSATVLQEELRRKVGLAKVQVPFYKELSTEELGPVTEYPMLRINFWWQDRPGVALNVLNSIDKALREELPFIKPQDWSVQDARLRVLTGQVARGRLTIRLHLTADEIKGWNLGQLEEMGRRIEKLAAAEARTAGASASPENILEKPEDPVISVERLTKAPDL